MSGTFQNVINLWQTVNCSEVEERDDEVDNIDYVVEYIDSEDEPPEVNEFPIVEDDEVETKHTVQLHCVQITNGEIENSIWSATPPDKPNVATNAARKIAQAKAGPLGLAKAAKSPSECLSLFLDADVMATITEHTNERIKLERQNYTRARDACDTDAVEIMAYLGILYIAGTVRDGRQKIDHLFEAKKGTGMEAVFLTMGLSRFTFLSRCLQFDDPATTEEETDTDKLAPIRAIYERIVTNFQKFFRPGRLLALGEQLTPFKGACEFRQSIPVKPCNVGLKYHLLVDCEIPYTCNVELCAPNNHKPYDLSYAPTDVAMRMTEPVQGKHKTIIVPPKFTSLETIKKLHDSRTMLIGEVPKPYTDIPKQFTVSKGRTENDTLTAYHEMASLISHMVRSKDLLILMSSYREESSDAETIVDDSDESPDPKIVQLYNRSKNVIQLIQQMCATYDVAKNTRRWQLIVFFNLMNLSAINAWCIYRMNHPESTLDRREFLTDMALELLRPQAQVRLYVKTITPVLRQRIGIFLGIEKSEYDIRPVSAKRDGARGRCYMCGRSRNKTTRTSCDSCGKFVCSDHYACVCYECTGDSAGTK
ncbi:AGAP002349-PA-like protein [Anopheles sinensis]|uniref:AGAP002349-PA-like protein n=1 Tax=Anopheles sinensis TaxID=74873 RepID=A0A084W6W7_ANOSI|nr:AGAP002349-PA-like protein [Anopheles sinensis]